MAPFSVHEVDHGWDELLKTVKQLKQGDAYVKVGMLGEKAAAVEHGDDGAGEQMTNVHLMMIHEFGVPERGIPERSVIRRVVDGKREGYFAQLRGLLKGIYEGKTTIQKVLELMGFRMKWDMKNAILEGPGIPPPNAPSTIKRKLAKGKWNRGSTASADPRPLVETGRLAAAIDHAVVLGGAPAPTQVEGSAFGTTAKD